MSFNLDNMLKEMAYAVSGEPRDRWRNTVVAEQDSARIYVCRICRQTHLTHRGDHREDHRTDAERIYNEGLWPLNSSDRHRLTLLDFNINDLDAYGGADIAGIPCLPQPLTYLLQTNFPPPVIRWIFGRVVHDRAFLAAMHAAYVIHPRTLLDFLDQQEMTR